MKRTAIASRAVLTEKDPRWRQVRLRDINADGAFVYSVATTGIFCRPSCGARLPLPENVRFHATAAEAEAAGFRPCKRCRPERPVRQPRQVKLIAEACRMIERNDQVRLKDIAHSVGLSPFHFHRTFRAITGVTPHQYANAIQTSRVRQRLQTSRNITEAVYDAGFQSSGKFYGAAREALGMTPSTFRNRGSGTVIRFAVGQCSLGSILVGATDRGVCAIFIGDDPQDLIRSLQESFACAELIGGDSEFEKIVGYVVGWVDMREKQLDLPLDIRGTAFQLRVWQELRKIPSGSTISYAELAARVGDPKSVRAVAGACAANTLAVAIPCHRVVRQNGGLSGYRWGVERKKELLEREARRKS